MNYEERLQNVTILGAAGKMGSGILLLTALEMADLSLKPGNRNKAFALNAVDVSNEALAGVMKYLRAQVLKMAEKKTVSLRKVYADRADLIENYDIVGQYVDDVMNLVHPTTRLEAAYDSTMIFEAIKEDPELKVKIFTTVRENNPNDPWYFTNTSSIPITELDEKAMLNGRIVGFHFYNPPAVQKLVELIRSKHTSEEVVEFAKQYAKNLRKVVVPANDFAGFIGNGHFMRDILHATLEVEKLMAKLSFTEAIYAVNRISQDYLIRPMGIFQLIDYVGIDVCSYIMSVMNPYLKEENLYSPMLDNMLTLGVKGGQFSDGSQKDGFLKYEKGKPVAVFDPETKTYIPVSGLQKNVDAVLGAAPPFQPWKSVIGSPAKEELLRNYFRNLKTNGSLGAELAKIYAARSKEIGQHLVRTGVALNENDVNTVLLTGFYHAYGPINDYLD
jgi:3-hydroxyacyl-CoA dehydrogenase